MLALCWQFSWFRIFYLQLWARVVPRFDIQNGETEDCITHIRLRQSRSHRQVFLLQLTSDWALGQHFLAKFWSVVPKHIQDLMSPLNWSQWKFQNHGLLLTYHIDAYKSKTHHCLDSITNVDCLRMSWCGTVFHYIHCKCTDLWPISVSLSYDIMRMIYHV